MGKLIKTFTLAFVISSCSSNPRKWSQDTIFSAPESAYFDPDTKFIFISSIAGEGTKKDSNGWISKLDIAGNVISEKWVTGLNAPKGMRSHKGVLWVSDIDEVLQININTAQVISKIKIKKAKFLNDVAIAPNGDVYISDTLTSTIHKIRNNKAKVFVKGKKWESPNGLLVQGNHLIVAAWGFTTDFNNSTSGHLYKIHIPSKKRTNLSKTPIGNLDGLEVHPNNPNHYFLSDWVSGEVFELIANEKAQNIKKFKQGTADIALINNDQKLQIIIPHMKQDRVSSYEP